MSIDLQSNTTSDGIATNQRDISDREVDAQVGLRLKGLRRGRGLSQTELARHLGVTFQQIQKYESGSNRISASKLWRLTQVFNVSLSYFFEDVGLVCEEDPEVSQAEAFVNAFYSIKDEQLRSGFAAFVTALAEKESAKADLMKD